MNITGILTSLRRWKLTAFTFYYMYRLIKKMTFFKVLRGMTLTMDDVDPAYLEGEENYDARFLSTTELYEFIKSGPRFELDERFLRWAAARGDSCFAFVDGGLLASYGWYTDKPDQLTDTLYLTFGRNYIYMYRGFTDPAYRGQRLHAKGMVAALRFFADRGYDGLISYVEADNFASLHSTARLGYRRFGTVLVVRLFGKYLTYHTKRCSEFSFRVGENVKAAG